MHRVSRPSAVTLLTGIALLAASLFAPFGAGSAVAHGSTQRPASRAYTCRFENPDNSMCAAAWAANSQALYDWMEVNIGDAAGRHRELIPDGQLCSAGRQKYAALDRPGNWPVTALQTDGSGLADLTYQNTAPHSTEYYRVYITRQGFDARTDALGWGDLELAHDSGRLERSASQTMRAALPNRDVPAILYIVWQRSDSPEAFYACSDVTVNGSSAPPPTPPTPTTASPATSSTIPATTTASTTPRSTVPPPPTPSSPPPSTVPSTLPSTVPSTLPSTPPSTGTAPSSTAATTAPDTAAPAPSISSPATTAPPSTVGSTATVPPPSTDDGRPIAVPPTTSGSTDATSKRSSTSGSLVIAVDDEQTTGGITERSVGPSPSSSAAPEESGEVPLPVGATVDRRTDVDPAGPVAADHGGDDDAIVALQAETVASTNPGGNNGLLFVAMAVVAIIGLATLAFGLWRSEQFA